MKRSVPQHAPGKPGHTPDMRKVRIGVLRARLDDYERATTASRRMQKAKEIVKFAQALLSDEQNNRIELGLSNSPS